MAGKIQKQVAEEYEADMNYEMAINAYRKASDYFSMENMNSRSYQQGCELKAADLMCISDHKEAYTEAKTVWISLTLDIRKDWNAIPQCSFAKIRC